MRNTYLEVPRRKSRAVKAEISTIPPLLYKRPPIVHSGVFVTAVCAGKDALLLLSYSSQPEMKMSTSKEK